MHIRSAIKLTQRDHLRQVVGIRAPAMTTPLQFVLVTQDWITKPMPPPWMWESLEGEAAQRVRKGLYLSGYRLEDIFEQEDWTIRVFEAFPKSCNAKTLLVRSQAEGQCACACSM